jgi:hypothetical protein
MILRKTTLMGTCLGENGIPIQSSNAVVQLNGWCNGKYGRINLSSVQLSTHCLLLGAIGTGKTNTMMHIIDQLQSRLTPQDVMLVFDPKNDFRPFHRSKDYLITNNSNTSAQRVGWNIFLDILADGWIDEHIVNNADEMAEVIFSEHIRTSQQPFFPTAARDIFSAVLKAMTLLGKNDEDYRTKYLNNKALSEYLRVLDASKMHEFLGGFASLTGVLKYVGDGRSEQALGVFAELQSITSPLFKKCFGLDSRFSVRNTVMQRGGRTLFVEYDPANGVSLQSLYRTIVDLFLKEALSPQKPNGKVFVLCDELKRLPYMNHFESALNFGRSLGVSIIAGIQSLDQLHEVYGDYGGKNIAAGFQTTLCFRTNSSASREFIKGIHGENLSVIQFLSPSSQTVEEKVLGHAVEDWDIISLKVGEAIVGLAGEKPFKFQFERYG